MTIAEVINKIEEKHVKIDSTETTCDGVICGNAVQECKGIVLTCCPTAALIKRAAGIGANLILCHEPTFYHGYDKTDWLEGTTVYERKKGLIEEHGLVIYRDHDRVHREQPDMIYSGIIKKLEWEPYALSDSFFPISGYEIPQTTLGELGRYLAGKLKLDGIRIVGDPEMSVKRVGLAAHFSGTDTDRECIVEIEKKDYDVILPLETVDWTITEYILDSITLGRPRAMLNAGHFNLEEPGMELMKDWLLEAVGHQIPITFIQSGNCYGWIDCRE